MQRSGKYPKPAALDWSRWWPAPAKLNLFLHILGQRENGYHELESVFQLLDLHDSLQFSKRKDGKILRTEGLDSVAPEADIVVQAAQLLRNYLIEQKHTSLPLAQAGVSIRCRKRIPVEAGMGGGSSDAATVLVVLNHLWECGLKRAELMQLALDIGADVPVFVAGSSAYARGIGELLESLEIPETCYLIAKPQASISTSEMFAQSRLTRASQPITIHAFMQGLREWPEYLPGTNDCQDCARELSPEIGQVIDWLGNFGTARLTGTGSAVFLPCASEITAKAIMDQASMNKTAQKWQFLIANGVNKSPLQTMLSKRRL